MAELRFKALEEIFKREAIKTNAPNKVTSEYFGANVFDQRKMKKYLNREAYDEFIQSAEKSEPIDRRLADQIAAGMKAWAMEKGATHYTHWFHPLTDSTAEKHDAFIEFSEFGGVVENFSGERLAQQEPDASSFPSGGLRNTFEARGYTAWDTSSPAFIIDRTLCIPTVFVSYTGEALDYKTPLLKSLTAVDKAATDVCQYFDKNVKRVTSNTGWEQEYFLIDESLYCARPDMMLTGRTLMGHASSKDQQMDDHYFGAIPERVKAFMHDFEQEAYLLGIPVKTRHNEVAPNQFECAPIFEETNLANDHNQLIMELMRRVARKHHFRILFHEKPFSGINGSGKHCNWSLSTDTGVNLFKPGRNPKSNLQFLTFLINTLMAVKKNNDLLRASISSAGNAHRMGANEAPPAIISAFLGRHLTHMLNEIVQKVPDEKHMDPDLKTELKLNIGKIPEILLDNTDRNRTSPFAFTGNRFEFRAVGSSANIASAMIVLNATITRQLKEFKKEVDDMIMSGIKKDDAIFQVLKKYIIESESIRFEGNGYSEEWAKEAEKRGLTNKNSVPESLTDYLRDDVRELFRSLGIYSGKELEGRVEVEFEKYTKIIQIEARVLGDLSINHIVPTAVNYMNLLIENVKGLKEIFEEMEYKSMAKGRIELIRNVSNHISNIKELVAEMIEERKKANRIENEHEKALAYDKNVRPYLDKIREHIDKLELVVDNEIWPLPKYRELLFSR
jgi:glutamine synthetase